MNAVARTARTLTCLVPLYGLAGPVCAQDSDDLQLDLSQPDLTPWSDEFPEPPELRSGDFDWVQLANGEWLKGEVVDLRDDVFIFDSDEVGELTLDWEDVAALYMHHESKVGLHDRTEVSGRVTVRGMTVRVLTDTGETLEFARAEVGDIVPSDGTELSLWSGKLSFGATIRSGNVDQTDISGFARVQRRDVGSRLTLEYRGAYGIVDDVENVNNHRGTAIYDQYLSDRLFWRVIGFEGLFDEVQNIDLRLRPFTALGYDIIETSRTEWTVFGGAGWQYTNFAGSDPSDESTAVLVGGTNLTYEATSRIDVGLNLDVFMPVPDTDTFNFRAIAFLAVELIDDLDLDVQVIWDRQNAPAPSADGSIPQRDDVSVYIGVGWSF